MTIPVPDPKRPFADVKRQWRRMHVVERDALRRLAESGTRVPEDRAPLVERYIGWQVDVAAKSIVAFPLLGVALGAVIGVVLLATDQPLFAMSFAPILLLLPSSLYKERRRRRLLEATARANGWRA